MALDWLPTAPSQFPPRRRQHPEPTSGLVPLPNALPPTELIWLGSHPDRFPARILHPSRFSGAVRPLVNFMMIGGSWRPRYVDVVRRRMLPTAEQQAFFFPWSAQPAIAKSLQWRPTYPSILRRATPPNRAVGEPFVSAGTIRILPIDCMHIRSEAYLASDLTPETLTASDFLSEALTLGGFLNEDFCANDRLGIGTAQRLLPIYSADGLPVYSADDLPLFASE